MNVGEFTQNVTWFGEMSVDMISEKVIIWGRELAEMLWAMSELGVRK